MTEAQLHKFTCDLLSLTARPDVLYLHIPNGVKATGQWAKMAGHWQKKMGIKPGAADWLIISRGDAFFLELKSKKGRQSTAQSDFELGVQVAGARYAVCHTPEKVQEQLTKWGVLLPLFPKRSAS